MDSVVKSIDKENKRDYSHSGKLARGGNTVLSFVAVTIVFILFIYAFYSLWYTYQVYDNAFLDSKLVDLKPVFNGADTDNRATFRELLAINNDTTAWVTIDDTFIDYPVMQGENNYEYVNKNVYGDFELAGSIFLASENSSDYSDPYNLLYGHHIKGGGMFGDVMKYRDKDYFDSRKNGILYLPDATYSITIYACVDCSAYDENIFYAPKEQSEMKEFQTWLRDNALYYRDIGITENDKIISLTTCENAVTDGRCAIVGRLDQIALQEQSFTDDFEDTSDEDYEAESDFEEGKIFVARNKSYYYLIIIGTFLLSLLIIALLQSPAYNRLDITDEEYWLLEKRQESKRKWMHRILFLTNWAVAAICIYLGRTIYEQISGTVSVITLSFLAYAEYIRRSKNNIL